MNLGARVALAMIALSAAAGCGEDACKTAAPSFQVDLSAPPATASSVASLSVTLELGGGARFERTYALGDTFTDGATSLSVELGSAGMNASSIAISVRGLDAGGELVAEGSGDFPLSPDGCNRFAIALDGATPGDGEVLDLGPDAGRPDAGEDAGDDAGEDAGEDAADTGEPDLGADGGVDSCGNGAIDPPELCDDNNTIAGDGCSPACVLEPGWICEMAGCRPVCGDTLLSTGEACDDGNIISGDGCSSACAEELGFNCTGDTCVPICGDALLRGPETCDDGNTNPNDGCNPACTVELGFDCQGLPSACVRCGNGLVERDEECDDTNLGAGDGCSSTCTFEAGFACTGVMPSACAPGCGNGLFDPLELCEDGGTIAGDGCSPSCAIELGWTCTGTVTSACTTICGDGYVRGAELCDDSNAIAGDGCTPACGLDDGFQCSGEPSVCENCGDGVHQGSEACDDGNELASDGCLGCAVEPGFACPPEGACAMTCSNGAIDAFELCDDAGLAAGDGCSPICAIEPGWSCTGAPSTCAPICGDGLLTGAEPCDDGATTAGDGCSAACAIEPGFACRSTPSSCAPICGDGMIAGPESCDDAGTTSGDGCSSACIRELGFICATPGAACAPVCGDALISGGESCDDGDIGGGDGCSSACAIEPGWTCNGEPSVCQSCGNGAIEGSEACDDANATGGDGCTACAIDNGWTCSGEPSMCELTCGDGVLLAGEACDDGDRDPGDGCSDACTIEVGWTCAGQPSICQNCGNNLVEGTELCDGTTVPNDDCFRHGYRPGAIGLSCIDCTTVDPTTCSNGPIDSAAQIQAAIADVTAIPGHQTIAVQAGTFAVATTIEIDECGGVPCASARPGMTIRPLEGAQVILSGALAGGVFRVRSGNNVISGFTLRDVTVGVHLEAGAFAGGNRVDHLHVRAEAVTPSDVIRVRSNDNEVLANRFENLLGVAGGRAIRVENAELNVVAMNAIYGPFSVGIDAENAGDTTIDHNSVWIPMLAGTGVRLNPTGPSVTICYRNNLIIGNALSTGVDFASSTRFRACGGVDAGSNAVLSHGTQCVGRCNDCMGAGPACDLSTNPGFSDSQLCLAAGNGLINSGRNVGHDMDDGTGALFRDTAPDVGARESGTSRNFGGLISTCP